VSRAFPRAKDSGTSAGWQRPTIAENWPPVCVSQKGMVCSMTCQKGMPLTLAAELASPSRMSSTSCSALMAPLPKRITMGPRPLSLKLSDLPLS